MDEDELDKYDPEPMNTFKDLGRVLNSEFKHIEQVGAAVQKMRNAALLIRRVFRQLSTIVLLRDYSALVRSVPDCCIQGWSPTTVGGMKKMKNVQRMTTKPVPAIGMFPLRSANSHSGGLLHAKALLTRRSYLRVTYVLNLSDFSQ